MPQMSPIWWSTLFLIFIVSYITIMMTMYFFNIYSIKYKKKQNNSNMKNIHWKW